VNQENLSSLVGLTVSAEKAYKLRPNFDRPTETLGQKKGKASLAEPNNPDGMWNRHAKTSKRERRESENGGVVTFAEKKKLEAM